MQTTIILSTVHILYETVDLHIWIIYAPLIGIREFKINEEKQSEAS